MIDIKLLSFLYVQSIQFDIHARFFLFTYRELVNLNIFQHIVE